MGSILKKYIGLVVMLFIICSIALINNPFKSKAASEDKIISSDNAAGDSLGSSVSIDGDYAVIGASADDSIGSAYVFYNNSGTWTQQAKLTPSDGATSDYFGVSVSISGDYVVVGASYDDDNGDSSGSAYVFEKPGGGWANMTQTAKLTASDGGNDDRLGNSVSISGDYVVVGAPGDTNESGSAYVFEKPGGGWANMTQTAKLTASDSSEFDRFATDIAISGNYIIAGAKSNDDACPGDINCDSGSAYIFERSGTWPSNETVKLTASDQSESSEYGSSVAINGSVAVVGAQFDNASSSYAGAVYVYGRNGGAWDVESKLTASDGAGSDLFGDSVTVSSNYIAVGATYDDDNGSLSGSAYVFEMPLTGWTTMTESKKLIASDGAGSDRFGASISVSGGNIIIGAAFDDNGNGLRSGSAYIYDYTDITSDFTDANFRNCINSATNGDGIITISEANGLAGSLSCASRNISNIAGAEYLTGIFQLNLYNNNVSDISPLQNLTNITYLSLNDNDVADLSPLANLTGLTDLHLRNNDVSDLSVIDWSQMTSLTYLGLRDSSLGDSNDNNVSNLAPLNSAPALVNLYLQNNNVSDLTTIPTLIGQLEILELWGNNMSDLSYLANATSIERLDIRDNPFSNSELSAIADSTSPGTELDTLQVLTMGYSMVTDISVIDWSALPNITSLYIGWFTPITTIAPLANLPNPGSLTALSIPYNHDLADINALSNFTNLTFLDMMDAESVTDLTPLQNLTNLTNTNLTYTANNMHDLSPLNGGLNGPGSACDAATQDCSCTNCFADNNSINLSNSTALDGYYAYNNLKQIAILEDTGSATVTHTIPTDITSEFTDTDFRECVADGIYSNPAASIDVFDAGDWTGTGGTELNCNSQNIDDLAGIEYLHSIIGLSINDNPIDDAGFAPIEQRDNLVWINFYSDGGTKINDIAELANFSSLESLGIGDHNVSDLSPIIGTGGSGKASQTLRTFHIWCNNIDDISNINNINFPALTNLAIGPGCGTNNITDFTSINSLSGLTDLGLSELAIDQTDFASINFNANLQTLELHNNDITTIDVLGALDNLTSLRLDNNNGITSLASIGSGNVNLADFASGNTINIQNCNGLNGGNAVNALSEVTNLQVAGATVLHNITDDISADFTDINYRTCVDNATPSAGISASEAAALITLDCNSSSISSIAGSQHLTGLTSLNLINNNITDISPLDGLSALDDLRLSQNNINDISTVNWGSINPSALYLAGNSLTNANNLSTATNINHLELSNNLLNDIGNLSGLNPQTLVLYGNLLDAADLSNIGSMTNLTNLNLGDNNINDISNLSGMTSLMELRLDENAVYDLSPLSGMSGLTSLNINNNLVSDIGILSSFSNLQTLTANTNNILNATPLQNLTNLTSTNISNNELSSITSLTGNAGFASGNNINIIDNFMLNGANSATALADVITLRSNGANVTHNITDNVWAFFNDTNYRSCVISAIQAQVVGATSNEGGSLLSGTEAYQLTTLNCELLGINNINGTQYLNPNGLTSFSVSNNNITTPTQIVNFTGLTDINFNNNPISTPDYFSALTNLTSLILQNTTITDLSAIGSSNTDLANFASGNTIDIRNISNLELSAEANLAEIHDHLEANGATVLHNIDWENCSNGIDDDDDGNIDGSDTYCQIPQLYFYVDYEDPTPGRDCTLSDPCDSIEDVINSRAFQTALTNPPVEILNIYVRNTKTDGGDTFFIYGMGTPSTDYHSVIITPWPGENKPVIDGSINGGGINIAGDNITIQGFEIHGDSNAVGIQFMGDNSIIKNNYVHEMTFGILAIDQSATGNASLNNTTIENNISVENGGIFAGNNGCGGIIISGGNNNSIINNTSYNNCRNFDNSGLTVFPGNLEISEISATSFAGVGISAPSNTTIKQNIVLNDFTGAGARTYYYNVDGENINGVAAAGEIFDQVAADHGSGNNFSVTTSSPFENAGISANWVAAGADFALTDSAYSTYQIGSPDASTPTTDFLGNTKPTGTTEAGAVEYLDSSNNNTGSSGQTNPSCNSDPIKLDLPEELSVSIIDGSPVVNLNWASITEVNSETKVNSLFNYLNTNPSIGKSGKKLINVFSAHIREKILENDDLTNKYYDKLDDMRLSDLIDCDCDNTEARAMYKIVKEIRKNARLKNIIDELIVNFVGDLLNLEQTLSETGRGNMPFTDFYRESSVSVDTEGVIKVYREGKLLHTESNTNNTSYVDRTIPTNSTGRVKYYSYHLVNETDCGSETGNNGKAQINPVVTEGTEINVNLNLKVKVKETYDQLVMQRIHKLLESTSNGNGGVYSEEACQEAKNEFLGRRTSVNTLNYLLECYAGNNTELRHKIEESKGDIVTPLILLLTLNRDSNSLSLEQVVDRYMNEVLEGLSEELAIEEGVLEDIGTLDLGSNLLNKTSIDDLTEDEKQLILQIDESYFGKLSHAADITVEVYGDDKMLREIETRTNILGESVVDLGILNAGKEFTLKIRLNTEKFVLPKIVTLEINNAEPQNDGAYAADIALTFSKHFKYGNFDESDDVIDKDDLIAWGKLLQNNPELWSDVNIDGLTGINLLDVITLQENWGNIEKMDIEENDITLKELLNTFGLSINSGFSGSSSVEVPEWVEYAGITCN